MTATAHRPPRVDPDPSVVPLQRRWYSVGEVAQMLGYGQSKVRMLIIQGDLKSLKDGGSRRVLPEWVDDYIQLRAAESDASR